MTVQSKFIAPLLVTLFSLGPVYAAGGVQLLNAVFKDEVVKTADGKTEHKLMPFQHIAPGETVVYVLTLKNQTAKPMDPPTISVPLQKDLEYISAGSGAVVPDVSVDGGKNFATLATLSIKLDGGTQRPARPADVTHIRWKFITAVKAGTEQKMSYTAKVK